MRIADFIRLHKDIMNLLSSCNVKMDDFKYVEMFGDYEVMREDGEKVSYIVAALAEKYGLCEASVYRVLRKFKATL